MQKNATLEKVELLVYKHTSLDRARFEFLDALRGVAALAVVLYHVGSRVGAPPLVPHGYLAVDFFFILSGFVMAHSYTDRLPQMGLWSFAWIRAERLLPLSILGVISGLLYMLLRWYIRPDLSDGITSIIFAATLNIFLIPKFWWGEASTDEMFPENGVLWSLSLEILANIIWAKFFINARSWIIAIVMLSGLAIVVLEVSSFGDADMGWGLSNYLGGIGRAIFGFLMGVLLWRYRTQTIALRGSGLLATCALIFVLILPATRWWVDVAIIAVIMPIIVYLASRVSLTSGKTFARLLGDISFPLYVVHLPVLLLLAGTIKSRGVIASWWAYGVTFFIILLAFAAWRLYDEPIRCRLAAWRKLAAAS